MATFGNGYWFLGSVISSTYSGTAITAGAGSTYRLGGGGGTLTISGTNVLTGVNNVEVGAAKTNGLGVVILSNSQGYSGTTTVNAGMLQVGADNRLGTGTGIANIVLNSGTLSFNATGTLNANRGIALGPTGSAGAGTLDVTAGILTYTGIMANNGTGTGSFTKTGAGTLILGGANTYTGSTNLNGGIVNFSALSNLGSGTAISFSTGTLQYAVGNTTDITARTVTLPGNGTVDIGTNNVTFSGSAITGAGNFTKTGSGTLYLNNGSNSYTGTTIISLGTLKLGSATVLAPASAFTLNTSTLDLNGFSPIVRNLAGSGTVLNNVAGSNNILTVTSAGASTFSGVIAETVGTGTISLVKTGANTLTLSGSNTYTGSTQIAAGALSINSDYHLGVAPSSTTLNSLVILSTATLQTTGTSFTLDSRRGITIGPTSGTGTATFDIASTKTVTYNGVITNNGTGTGALAKANTGVLILGGANSYSGDTTITAGAIKIGTTEAIPHGFGKGNVIATGTLDLNGTSITINGLSGAGVVTNNLLPSTAILTVGDNNQGGTFSGVIKNNSTGIVGLTKIGTATLTLSGANTQTGTTTIAGGVLSVGADTNLGGTSSALVISSGTLYTSTSFTMNSARSLFVGPDAGSGAGVIDIAAGTSLTYAGVIANNGTSTSGLTKTNTNGTLVLGGVNTYSGTTQILGGTLQLTSATAIPSGSGKGNLFLDAGSTLDVNSLNATVNGLSGTGTITNSQGTSVTFSAGGYDQTSTFGGVIQEGSTNNSKLALTKIGTGTLTLSGANTYSGSTIVSGGTLKLGSASAIPFGTGKGNVTVNGTLDLSGASININGLLGTGTVTNSISSGTAILTAGDNDQTSTFAGSIQNSAGNGGVALTKIGAGTLTLSGSNSYSGATLISSGTLAVGSATGLSGNSSINIAGGSVLDVNGFNATIDGLTGTGDILNNGAVAVTLTAGAGGGSGVFDGKIKDGAKAISLTKSGAGTLTLTSLNTYSGATTISNGTISVADTTYLGSSTAAIVLGDATHKGTLSYTTSADLSYTRGFTVNAGGGEMDIMASGKTLTIQTGSILANGMFTVGGNGDAVLQSTISGTSGLTKANSGLMVISGSNSYSGDTVVSVGTLRLANANAIPSGTGKGNVAVNGSSVLDINGSSLSINGLSGSGIITSNAPAGALTLTVGGNDQNGTFSGVIQKGSADLLALTKTGTGRQTLSGTNNYNGVTTVSAGTLQIGNAAALPSGNDISLSRNGTLDMAFTGSSSINLLTGSGTLTSSQGNATLAVGSGNSSSTFAGNIREDGGILGLTKIGTGMLTLSGSNSFSGATTISTGTLSMGSTTGLSFRSSLFIDNAGALDINGYSVAIDGLAGTGAITNNNAATVTLTTGASGGSGTFGGRIEDGSGAIALTKAGAGTITLTSRNTYSGGTKVTGGTLAIAADDNLGTAAGNIILDGGALSVINTFAISSSRGIFIGPASGSGFGALDVAAGQTLTYGGTIANQGSGTGGLTKIGQGTLLLTHANTYSGDTIVSVGALQVGSDSAIPFGVGKGNVIVNDLLDLNNHSITLNGLSGSGIVGNSLAGAVTLTVGDNNANGSFSGAIRNENGHLALTKIGAGTQALTGSSNYSDGTLLQGGTLLIQQAAGLGMDDGSADTALTIQNGTLEAAGTFATPRLVHLTHANSAIAVDAGQNLTLAGVVDGSGNLTKSGAGKLTLTAANSYAATTISTGTLQIGNGGASGSLGSGSVTDNAALVFIRSDTVTVSNVITGSGTLTQAGSGIVKLTASNNYAGGTFLDNGTLNFTHDAIGSGNVTFNGGILQWETGNTRDVSGQFAAIATGQNARLDSLNNEIVLNSAITGLGGLQKLGTGTITLAAANDYAGATTIDAGKLIVGAAGTLGGGSVTNNADLEFQHHDVYSVANVISGSGRVIQNGSGTLMLTASNSYSGDTVLAKGTVNFASASNLGTGAIVFQGATLQWGADNSADVSARFAPIAAGQTALLDTNGNNVTLNSAMTGQGGLTKLGAGNLTLTASSSYTGATLLTSGTLGVTGAGNLNSSSGVTVVNGAVLAYNADTLMTSPLTIADGTITGTGRVNNLSLIIGTSATMSPGNNSPGTQAYSDLTLANGGRYLWELDEVKTTKGEQDAGLKGMDPGFDFANITGVLTITATATDRFVIDITGLTHDTHQLGAVTNWDGSTDRTFTIATAAGGVVGFDARKFLLKVDNFDVNNLMPEGSMWLIEQRGPNDVILTYHTVPEPAALALLLLGALPLLRRRRASV